MKKVFCSLMLVSVLCFSVVPATVLAAEESNELGFWFEVQAIGNGTKRVTGLYEREIAGPFGLYVLANAETGDYRQFYAGPTWKPFEWLKVGVGVGSEHVSSDEGVSDSTRYNAFFDIKWEKISLYGTFEHSVSGSWHSVTAIYKVFEKTGIGLMDERGLGFGPRIEYNIWGNVNVWGALLRSHDDATLTPNIAVNFSF